ncbi:alpha-L-rhamnosidase [Sphingomonas insulae]|uniref:alpha-L-rhamnosidase n=1 Tax=Sphingomonas insulae TaxID=424800 RepID=A0ABN1HQC2_9SPHN|nr:family 78 glycoside hydrolase catalytic domain [Sphingomonas insulae]NIJ29431.1 alpha-L-rhamnosidase [Sphingomonas insulae]
MPSIDRRALMTGIGAGTALLTSSADAADAGSLRVSDLRTAGLRDPLAVGDARPMLAWRITGPDTTMQAAFQIRVAGDRARLIAGDADLWDSGRVVDTTSTGVRYAGRPLGPRQRCWWQVRVWDATGAVSSWSAPASWGMALADGDWRGEWLAVESADERDDRLVPPRWSRTDLPDDKGPARFRLRFASDAGDGPFTIDTRSRLVGLSLDGRPVAVPVWHKDAYGPPPAARFVLPLTKGEHVLIAEVAPRRDGDTVSATLAAQLRSPHAGGGARRIVEGWEAATPYGAWRPAALDARQDHFAWPPTPARLLRRRFDLAAVPRTARLHIAALGGYRILINGRRVGDDELQSEPAEYRRRIPCRTYDVAGLLRTGENVVAVMVGDGFYASYQAPDGRYAYGPAPRRFRLMIEDGAGTPFVLGDDRWRHHEAPITLSEIYAGEDHDRRRWPAGWNAPGFDDRGWDAAWPAPPPPATPSPPLGPPIRVSRTIRPAAIRRIGANAHIVDFGQNFAGRVRLSVRGNRGDTVVVTHAEILDRDGALDRRNLRVARAQDRYTLAGGGTEVLEPVFTFQGFRYAQVDGIADLPPDQVTGLVVSSDLDEIGTFTVAQPLVQKLWLNTLWSQRSNFRGNPTDCPQRDERLGWTGDAQVFWDTAAFNMDVGGFTRSFTRMLRDDQAANGAYPMWSPSPRGLGWGSDTATPGWADAGVMLPYVACLHTGDRSVVDDNWAAMAAYCDGILGMNPDGLWRHGRGADLGDWLALDARWPGDETTPKPLIASAMLARSLDQMATMAAWIGRADTRHWQAKAARTRAAFAQAFVAADGAVGNGSHTGYILALRLRLVPDVLRARAGQRLAREVDRRGRLLTTGFLGTPLGLDALADAGHDRLAFDLLLRTDYPSWGYMARQAATTIWERWNGDTGDVSMNSFNHYALGAVCSFLYRRIGGVEPVEPGFRRFRVAPLFDPRFASAGVSLDSASGRIETAWRRTGGQVTLDLAVPANTLAQVVLPGIDRTCRPGRHRLVVRA